MQSTECSELQKVDSSEPCACWSVDLKLTHLDWSPDATLIHFQGQYLNICESDYDVLQVEIQNVPKTKAAVNLGEVCLVEDLNSAHWYRGRVQNQKGDLFEVFLIDHGNVLNVDMARISSCSNDLFILPPKIVFGFLANVLLPPSCSNSVIEDYFSTQIGKNVKGYIQAFLPHKVLLLLLEVPDINTDLVKHGFGRHVDTNTFLLLVEMLIEAPLKQKNQLVLRYQDILSFCGPRLNCGARAEMRVTAAVNQGLFYCQLSSIRTELLQMSRRLAAICEFRNKEYNHKTPENLGSLCAVKSKDGEWYRGFVQSDSFNSQVRVLFVDYGYFESVTVENVHSLPPGFDSMPFMALPCSFRSDQNESVKAQQLRFLKAGLLGKVLDVEIISFDEEKHLYSVTVTSDGGPRVEEPEPFQEVPKIIVKPDIESFQYVYLYQEAVIREALVKTLEAEEVQLDSVFMGYVEHIQDPNHFWIRTEKSNDDFEEVMTEIADHFSKVKLEDDVLWNPELGTICSALYEKNMHFYRAVVTDTLEGGSEVLFMDFGNIEKVPHRFIKMLPKTVASKPAFAFCCSLVNVIPFEGEWTNANSDFFRMAVSNKAVQVHVLQLTKNKCIVDLCDVGSGSKQNITELMISSNQAQYWNKLPINLLMQNNTDVTSHINGNIKQLKFCDDEEENHMDETQMAQALPCFKLQNIKPGFEFAVCCSDINTPSDFWCQPLDGVPALEDLMDKVQQYYSTHTVPLQSEDLCCVAQSPQDGKWYRAVIMEKERDHTKVILVDYGHTIHIKDSRLQAIMPEYVNLERQAFWCSLHNLIEPADPQHYGNWSPEVCRILKDFVCDSTCDLRCQVISQVNVKDKGLCSVVDICNTKTNQSITKLLLQQGLAKEVTVSTKQLSELPESFVFSSYDLRPGKDELVYVTHVSSQWDVYCQLVRNSNIVKELEKKISDQTHKIRQASSRDVGGKLCLAKFLDGEWYRGVALPVQSSLHVSVFFVDYGNTYISEKTQIMFIPRDCGELLCTPMQAIKCNLASVSKKEFYAVVKEWLNDALLNKTVKVQIIGRAKDGAFDVELFDGGVNINKKVKKFIASITPKLKSVVTQNLVKTENCQVNPQKNSESKQNREMPDTNVNSEQPQYTEESEIPQENVDIKEKRETPDTNVKSDQPQYTETSEIPLLSCLPNMKVTKGFRGLCFVSHIDSVKSFFLQLSEDEPALLKMVQDLNSDIVKDSLKTSPTLRINDLVLAVYEEDGAFYRSTVKGYERSSFIIEFVDYGNSAVIMKDKIYALPKEHLSQPRFSIPCSLLDASIYKNDASFVDAVMEKPLMVDFVHQYGAHWVVQIQVLDSVVDPPPPLEASVESSTEIKKEENNIQMLPSPKLTRQVATRSSKVNIKFRPHKKHLRHKIHSKTVKCSNKPKNDCTNKLMSLAVHAKETENCKILTVLCNGSFYIRLNRASELLPALQSHIANNLYKYSLVSEKDVKQGLKCLVQVENTKEWHRASVQTVSQGKCQVLLVDYGITDEILSCSIRQQGGNLTKVPDLAVLCKVNCLGFGKEEDTSKWWCEALKPLMGSDIKLMFVCYSDSDKLWRVEIIMNGVFAFHQMTVALQQNEKKISPPSESQSENAGLLDTSQPQEFAVAPVVLDRMYSGCATTANTPFDFYVFLEDALHIMNKISIMLNSMSGQMCHLPEADLVPGTGCLFESNTKNKWCRAEIVQCDTTVILNLVDYGHYESISSKNCFKLRRLPVEIAKLPKVLYPCCLRGVEPVRADGQWTHEAAVFFEQCMYQKSLRIFFRELVSNTRWRVDILTDDLHVATELVNAGHASYTDSLLGVRLKEQSPRDAAPDSEEEYEDEACDCESEQEGGEVPKSIGVSGARHSPDAGADPALTRAVPPRRLTRFGEAHRKRPVCGQRTVKQRTLYGCAYPDST
ncbi:tudor domain-containing protein 15 [Antennarius striatus]|uniref:tudor domain-containing protein 15 n=1 Tax=Antennarius striatus TaxID=241820 RepID=UPI0035AE4C98